MAYYTTNHGEQALTSSLTEALNAQNITLQPLDLLTSEIPEDCSLLIINAPTSDFASDDGLVDEVSMLQNYLNEGGKMLLTTNIYDETPNLDALMAEFGLSRESWWKVIPAIRCTATRTPCSRITAPRRRARP